MPSITRLAEVVLYSLLNFVPYFFLGFYPFRHNLRFGKHFNAVIFVILCFMHVGFGIWTAFFDNGNSGIISIITTLTYAFFYFIIVKANFGKSLFTLLMLSNISNFIVIASKCIEGLFSVEMALQDYRWSYSVAMIPICLITLIPLFIYVKKQYTPAIEKKSIGTEWHYLWLIPTTFYLMWYRNIYFGDKSSLEIALEPSNTIFLLLINIGAILVYSVVIRLVNEQAKIAELEETNHQYDLQSLQYENLCERINEAKSARHDLHHHIMVIKGFSANKDYEKLDDYLNTYLRTSPDDSVIVFCDHYVINIITLYYAHIAKENHIDFSVHLKIPSDIPINDNDLGVLLGNMLENAVEACNAMKSSERKIVFHGRIDNENAIIFTLDNTYENKVETTTNGVLKSTKHFGSGIGIVSINNIVKRYNGVCRIEPKEHLFCMSVLLQYK